MALLLLRARRHRRHWPQQQADRGMFDNTTASTVLSSIAPSFVGRSQPSPSTLDNHHGLVVLLCHGRHGRYDHHGPGKSETERREDLAILAGTICRTATGPPK
jgi:hypothetical protein